MGLSFSKLKLKFDSNFMLALNLIKILCSIDINEYIKMQYDTDISNLIGIHFE